MKCPNCDHENPSDAKFCQRCGAPLEHGRAPMVLTEEGRAWWYPIGVWIILTVFFLFLDLATTGGVTWSVWPIGIVGIFLVGFTFLRYAEERYRRSRA